MEMHALTLFFSAEELHQRVAKKGIGLATVYRFLNAMENKGEIHVFLCGSRKIYSLSKKNHAHFTCEKCGAMRHIQLQHADFLTQNIEGKACHFQIDVAGICRECLRQTGC